MIEKTITIYETDCGKDYKSKAGAKAHEKKCICWTNPKTRTCLTCDHFSGNSYEYFACEKSDWSSPPTPPHENAPNINSNCPLWERQ